MASKCKASQIFFLEFKKWFQNFKPAITIIFFGGGGVIHRGNWEKDEILVRKDSFNVSILKSHNRTTKLLL
jgi:hypothetical protein